MNRRQFHFKYLKKPGQIVQKVFTFYFYQDMLFYDGIIFRETSDLAL